MPLTRPHFIDKSWPNGIDLRKAVGGYLPREGIFPDPTTVDPLGIAYANGSWNIGARAFVLCSKRGGAPYSQSYGSALGTNDSSATGWTITANASGSTRVDRLWVRFVDPTQAEALTTPGGETVPRAVPIFGVTEGTPGIQPLPAGAVEIAQVSTPNAAGSIASSTITQTYKFAQTVGGTIYVRTIAERDALTNVIEGDECHVINTDTTYEYFGSTIGWMHKAGKADISAYTGATIYSAGSPTPRALLVAGRVNLEGVIISSSATFVAGFVYDVGSIPAAVAPKTQQVFSVHTNSASVAQVIVNTTGALQFRSDVGFTGALALSLDGASWVHKLLLP